MVVLDEELEEMGSGVITGCLCCLLAHVGGFFIGTCSHSRCESHVYIQVAFAVYERYKEAD